MDLERVVLRYLAEEEFASAAELTELVRLHGLDRSVGEQLLETWFRRGWLELCEQGETGLPPLLHLTDQAYADQTVVGTGHLTYVAANRTLY